MDLSKEYKVYDKSTWSRFQKLLWYTIGYKEDYYSKIFWVVDLHFVIFVLILVAVCSSLGYGAFHLDGQCEIPGDKYVDIHRMRTEFPEITPMINSAMADGHINRFEYNEICRESVDIVKGKISNSENWDFLDE
ncbi:MAG: hypothetical protein ACW99G_18255 [Candidatus Thorarchaeota archaeon]|jgi:hypothetical protein